MGLAAVGCFRRRYDLHGLSLPVDGGVCPNKAAAVHCAYGGDTQSCRPCSRGLRGSRSNCGRGPAITKGSDFLTSTGPFFPKLTTNPGRLTRRFGGRCTTKISVAFASGRCVGPKADVM